MSADTLRSIGPYVLKDVIGQGGMGRVYRATQPGLERDIALKTIRPAGACDAEMMQRFEREAKVLSRLQSPHVVRILDAGAEGENLWLAMELLEGRTLREMLQYSERIGVLDAVAIARDLARGLAAVHDLGLVHRDVKPANVMITSAGAVKLMDFGLAKDMSQTPLTEAGNIPGTPAFVAPEMMVGEPYDHRVDVYQCGLVLYVMLTGRLAHEATSLPDYIELVCKQPPLPPSHFNPEVTHSLDDLVLRSVAARAGRRPPTAMDLADALDHLLIEGSLARKRPPRERRSTGGSKGRAARALPSAGVDLRATPHGWLVITGGLVAMAIVGVFFLFPDPNAYSGLRATNDPTVSPPPSPSPSPSPSSVTLTRPSPPATSTPTPTSTPDPNTTATTARDLTAHINANLTPRTFARIRDLMRALSTPADPAKLKALAATVRDLVDTQFARGPLADAARRHLTAHPHLHDNPLLSATERSALLLAVADVRLWSLFLTEAFRIPFPVPDLPCPGLTEEPGLLGSLDAIVAFDFAGSTLAPVPARHRVPIEPPRAFNEAEHELAGAPVRSDLRVTSLPPLPSLKRAALAYRIAGGDPTSRLIVRLGPAGGPLEGHEAAVLSAPGGTSWRDGVVRVDPRLLAGKPGLTIHYHHESVNFGSSPLLIERLVLLGSESDR